MGSPSSEQALQSTIFVEKKKKQKTHQLWKLNYTIINGSFHAVRVHPQSVIFTINARGIFSL